MHVLAKLQAWWKFGASSELHQWNGEVVPPWKQGVAPAPLRMIPGMDSALRVRIDMAHTWAIGVGKEFAASCIILLCQLGVWPRRSICGQLDCAFEHFQTWRHLHKETCKLSEFSLKTFKIQSHPGGIQTCAVDIELDSSAHIAPRSLIEAATVSCAWRCWKRLHLRLQVVGLCTGG